MAGRSTTRSRKGLRRCTGECALRLHAAFEGFVSPKKCAFLGKLPLLSFQSELNLAAVTQLICHCVLTSVPPLSASLSAPSSLTFAFFQ